jgi:hypothetical protein
MGGGAINRRAKGSQMQVVPPSNLPSNSRDGGRSLYNANGLPRVNNPNMSFGEYVDNRTLARPATARPGAFTPDATFGQMQRDYMSRGGDQISTYGGEGGEMSTMDMLREAVDSDYERMQGAADRQWQRLDLVNQEFAGRIDPAADRARNVGFEQADELTRLAEEDRAFFEQKSDEILGEYKNLSAQQTMAQITGMRRNVEQSLFEIESDPNLTPAQKMAQKERIRLGVNEQTSAVAAQLGAQYNEARATLGLNLNQQRLGSQQMRQGMYAQAASMRMAAEAAATELELGGLVTLSNLIRSNPETVVSQVTGLAQLMAIESSGGGGGVFSPSGFMGGGGSESAPFGPQWNWGSQGDEARDYVRANRGGEDEEFEPASEGMQR